MFVLVSIFCVIHVSVHELGLCSVIDTNIVDMLFGVALIAHIVVEPCEGMLVMKGVSLCSRSWA